MLHRIKDTRCREGGGGALPRPARFGRAGRDNYSPGQKVRGDMLVVWKQRLAVCFRCRLGIHCRRPWATPYRLIGKCTGHVHVRPL